MGDIKMDKSQITFEIREIDSWFDGECWCDNTSYVIGEYHSKAKDQKKAFRNALHNLGIRFYKWKTIVIDYGDYLEVLCRSSGEVLFRAMPIEF